jgi:uncharacterized membrane protein
MLEEDFIFHLLESLSFFINITSAVIMLWGFLKAIVSFLHNEINSKTDLEKLTGLQSTRCQLGAYLLFGLELMIVADIIDTMIERSAEELIFLASIIVLRTLFSYFLGKEMEALSSVKENHRKKVSLDPTG